MTRTDRLLHAARPRAMLIATDCTGNHRHCHEVGALLEEVAGLRIGNAELRNTAAGLIRDMERHLRHYRREMAR